MVSDKSHNMVAGFGQDGCNDVAGNEVVTRLVQKVGPIDFKTKVSIPQVAEIGMHWMITESDETISHAREGMVCGGHTFDASSFKFGRF